MTTGPEPRIRTDAASGAGPDRARLDRRRRITGPSAARQPVRQRARHEPVEDRERVERPGRTFGVVLDRLDRAARDGAAPPPSRR